MSGTAIRDRSERGSARGTVPDRSPRLTLRTTFYEKRNRVARWIISPRLVAVGNRVDTDYVRSLRYKSTRSKFRVLGIDYWVFLIRASRIESESVCYSTKLLTFVQIIGLVSDRLDADDVHSVQCENTRWMSKFWVFGINYCYLVLLDSTSNQSFWIRICLLLDETCQYLVKLLV